MDLDGSRWLVLGAAGYVGRRLVATLRSRGAKVLGSDLRQPAGETGAFLVGDIREAAFVEEALAASRAHTVVHLASYGMSGGEMADPTTSWAVNVGGTTLVAQACRRHSAALVYISTVNVCFDGREVFAGDENMPYADPAGHTDGYSASKTQAEKIALEIVPDCVALRPYGIYGDGEERHFVRICSLFSWGLYMQIGSPADLSDWVYVDNLVHAIILAHVNMSKCRGQSYFIGDGEPINTIDLCAPFWTMISGASRGRLWIPYAIIYRVAWVCEKLRIPLLSRAEVNKVARTHYWKTDRVRTELGYRPLVSRQEGLRRMYTYFESVLLRQGYPARYRAFQKRLQFLVLLICFLVVYAAGF